MTLQASPSETNGFDALSPKIKKWVWKQGWTELRDVQTKAIPHLLAGGDAIISAATAGGKTEAAFLPLLSRVTERPSSGSFDILYISPLKALINDQYRRLEGLCEDIDVSATKWHGDVSSGIKQKALKRPGGVLLITPESLEALLMRRGLQVGRLFGQTQAIIIDELHAFMGTERGVQLRSLLNRVECLAGRRIDRIGLSATLGDMSMAAEYLRDNTDIAMPIIEGSSDGTKLKLQLRSYIEERPDGAKGDDHVSAFQKISSHIFDAVRGSHNLIFAGSKKNVELYGATLRDLCTDSRLPNEFFTHHANISKSDREALERRLKEGRLPTSAVCTSTLELGIDIGDVETVVQIGASGSVSALRQRLGRSGRRDGKPAILRAYNFSYELTEKAHVLDYLRPHLVQAIAEIELLLEGVYEPPSSKRLHLSTLVHQILAVIVERGGMRASGLFKILSRSAPFNNLSAELFKDMLRAMARPSSKLIEQSPDGTLLLGSEGERLTSHYSFYAVFETQEEFRVLCNGKDLGSLPVIGPTAKDMVIIFSGRRWKVVDVHVSDKVIEVKPAKGGNPPKFEGNGPSRHAIVDEKMRQIYRADETYRYLDETSLGLLNEGRRSFQHYGLAGRSYVPQGDGFILFPWAGSAMIDALMMLFQHEDYTVENEDYAVTVSAISEKEMVGIIDRLASGEMHDFEEMAWTVKNKPMGQYDHNLTDELLVQQIVSTLPSTQRFQAWANFVIGKHQ